MKIGDIFIYISYMRPHFSSAVPGLYNVGGVKCQAFLNHSNQWKWGLKMFQGKRVLPVS